ncbi:MAG: type II secretion system protein [Armatimonadota bacterium]|jgi:hypothetical protein
MSAPRTRAGFTAEELIVVLGIIVLMMLGFVWATHNVHAASRMTSCASNLRQLGQASRMYMADNTGRMPCGRMPDAPEPAVALMDYVQNEQVFLCPAAANVRRDDAGDDGAERLWPRDEGWRPQYEYTYEFDLAARSDDPAQALVARDTVPDRHLRRTWLGARLDGAIQRFDADEWDARWKEVTDDDTAQAW